MRFFLPPGTLAYNYSQTNHVILREPEAPVAHIIKKEAPALMEAFHTQLPREICDLVYRYLCVLANPIEIALSGQQGAPLNPSIIGSEGQLMEASYFGDVVATELSETYWPKNRFEFMIGLDNGMRVSALDIFLSQSH
jgi:hypothetical protein